MDGSHDDTSGNRLYADVTTSSGSLIVKAGTICLGVQNFISTNATTVPSSYDAIIVATINKAPQSVSGRGIDISMGN